MSWASITLTIVVVINILFFLAGDSELNSPILGILKGFVTGTFNIDWSALLSWGNLAHLGAITVLATGVSLALNPTAILTGNYVTIQTLTIIAISIFVGLFALPNFGASGIPEPLLTIISVTFGFMAVMSIFGLLRGE
jgi:hypothetical protein